MNGNGNEGPKRREAHHGPRGVDSVPPDGAGRRLHGDLVSFTVGQVAGHQLSDVMEELLRGRHLVLARGAVLRMEEALSDERTRTHDAVQEEYARLARIELRAARARHELARLEMESSSPERGW